MGIPTEQEQLNLLATTLQTVSEGALENDNKLLGLINILIEKVGELDAKVQVLESEVVILSHRIENLESPGVTH